MDFFWPLENLIFDIIFITLPLLLIFYGIDSYVSWKEGYHERRQKVRISLKGKFNGFFFLGVIGLVLMSGVWQSDILVPLGIVSLELFDLIRDVGLILLAIMSFVFTPSEIHKENHYSWEPLKEVAKLFFGIFMTVIVHLNSLLQYFPCHLD